MKTVLHRKNDPKAITFQDKVDLIKKVVDFLVENKVVDSDCVPLRGTLMGVLQESGIYLSESNRLDAMATVIEWVDFVRGSDWQDKNLDIFIDKFDEWTNEFVGDE